MKILSVKSFRPPAPWEMFTTPGDSLTDLTGPSEQEARDLTDNVFTGLDSACMCHGACVESTHLPPFNSAVKFLWETSSCLLSLFCLGT